MKRYLVFFGEQYYPAGGMEDLAGEYDSLDEVRTAVRGLEPDRSYFWVQVWDTVENRELDAIEYEEGGEQE